MTEQTDQQDGEREGMLPLERRTYLMGLASGATASAAAGGAAAAASSSADDESTPSPDYDGDIWVGYGNGEYGSGRYGDTGPPSLPGIDELPQDLDGDGLFEDIRGTGEFTIFDVQAFFNRLDSDEVQRYAPFFDFNQDGQVAIFDVQALFNKLQNWDGN